MRDDFNTALTPEEEVAFQQWLLEQGRANDLEDYDMRGAWKEGISSDPNGHFPDTYKKPNHPTFSTESMYNGHGSVGGEWVPGPNNTWVFQASQDNLKHHTPEELQQYFQQVEEPNGNKLVLPLVDSMLAHEGY